MLHMSQDMWSLSAKLSSRPSRWLQWSIRCDCQRPHRPQRWDKPVPKYNHQKILTIWVHELNQYLQYTEICRTCSGGQEHGTSTDCFKYFLTLFAQGQHVLSSTVSLPHSDTTLVVFTGVQAAFANLHREPIHSQIPSQQFVCVKRCSSVHDIYLRDHVKDLSHLEPLLPFLFFSLHLFTDVQSFIRLLQRLIGTTLLDCRNHRMCFGKQESCAPFAVLNMKQNNVNKLKRGIINVIRIIGMNIAQANLDPAPVPAFTRLCRWALRTAAMAKVASKVPCSTKRPKGS